MANQLNATAELLVNALMRDHPDWEDFVLPYGPDDDIAAHPGCVRVSVPFSLKPEHRIEVALRGDTIEVAYEVGGTCGRAEQEFMFNDGDRVNAIESVCELINALYKGQTVVVVEQLGKVTRWLRRDGITELAWFRPKK